MKGKQQITYQSIHPVYECLRFLEEYAQQGYETYDVLYEGLIKKKLFDETILKKKIKATKALQHKVIQAIKPSQQDLAFYFQYFQDSMETIARNLCDAYIDYTIEDYDEQMQQAYSLVKEHGSIPWMMMCSQDDSFFENDDVKKEGFDFIQALNQRIQIDDAQRWKLIQVQTNIAYHLEYFFQLIQPGVEVILKERERLSNVIEPFQAYIQHQVEHFIAQEKPIGIHSFCYGDFVSTSTIVEKVVIIPTLAQLNAVDEKYREFYTKKGNLIFIGILMDDSYKRENHLSEKEELLQILKTLQDGNRFEILSLLKKQELYGQQICDALKLSKATVSHHMNALSMIHVVKMKEVKKRVYYSLDQEYIALFLERLKEELLD